MRMREPQTRDVLKTLRTYHQRTIADSRHRYRSWEHCYFYFQTLNEGSSPEARRVGALHLAFFLASWGMYRGSSFLLQQDYTVHEPIVAHLLSPVCTALRSVRTTAVVGDPELSEAILRASAFMRQTYAPFGNATDTLITKVLLGTTACLPACDRYFVVGYKAAGFRFTRLNAHFIETVLELGRFPAFRSAQEELRARSETSYPLMKVIDMYYWQKGYELSRPNDVTA
jgi:hypothetical protein